MFDGIKRIISERRQRVRDFERLNYEPVPKTYIHNPNTSYEDEITSVFNFLKREFAYLNLTDEALRNEAQTGLLQARSNPDLVCRQIIYTPEVLGDTTSNNPLQPRQQIRIRFKMEFTI